MANDQVRGAQTWQLFELYLEALANIVKCDGSLE